jgi:hypothetical protein
MSLEKITKGAVGAHEKKNQDFHKGDSPGKLYTKIYNLTNKYSPLVANYMQYVPAILNKIF